MGLRIGRGERPTWGRDICVSHRPASGSSPELLGDVNDVAQTKQLELGHCGGDTMRPGSSQACAASNQQLQCCPSRAEAGSPRLLSASALVQGFVVVSRSEHPRPML